MAKLRYYISGPPEDPNSWGLVETANGGGGGVSDPFQVMDIAYVMTGDDIPITDAQWGQMSSGFKFMLPNPAHPTPGIYETNGTNTLAFLYGLDAFDQDMLIKTAAMMTNFEDFANAKIAPTLILPAGGWKDPMEWDKEMGLSMSDADIVVNAVLPNAGVTDPNTLRTVLQDIDAALGSGSSGGGLPLVRATIEFTDDDVSLNDSVWEGFSSSDIAVISNVNHSSPGIYRGNGTSTPDRATEFDEADGFMLISYMQMDNPSNQNPSGARVTYFVPSGFDWTGTIKAFESTVQASNVVGSLYPKPPGSGTFTLTSTDGVLSWE